MTIPASKAGPSHDEVVSHEYFPTCHCKGITTIEMQVPPTYDLFKEREAVTNLFLNVHGMLQYIHNLEAQIQEVENDGGYSHSRESRVRQPTPIRPDIGPID